VLVEHKSAGEDLGKAKSQGMAYIRGLQDTGREKEIPRWLIVSDFTRIALHDLEPEQDADAPLLKRLPPTVEFPLADLHKHVRHFAFIAGYTQHKLNPEDPANFEATELMCKLHDALDAGGYTGHELRQFLVRILFCLFAEDNGIFPTKAFELFIRDRTAPDGSDLGVHLEHLFRVLNNDIPKRQKNLDEELAQFPYVNGDLFKESLTFADFTADMRNGLLACCGFQWDTISPAVFGSLFQGIMDSKERRQIGAHYTAEKNILKLIWSLFLDDLRAEFETIKADKSTRRTARLQEFQDKLSKLRFFDPACGCGNFLVIAYRELRKLELEVLLESHDAQHEMPLDAVNQLSKLNVHQFYGIEIEEFPARIAEVALWLTDHQANVALSQAFGQMYQRLPLRASPHIVLGNALRMDWRTVLPPDQCSFVLGNPPFIGAKEKTDHQREDLDGVWADVKGHRILDYVCAWYRKAAEYIQGTQIRCAFVSTNSITQGEQVGLFWKTLFDRFGISITFAHRTFPWTSEARGKAHVHVVIIGFSAIKDSASKRLFEYVGDEATMTLVRNINPYLVEGNDLAVTTRSRPLCACAPEMMKGGEATDDGHLLFTTQEKDELLKTHPNITPFIRKFVGGREFINGLDRWCLWLVNAGPEQVRSWPEVVARLQRVKEFREQSSKARTLEIAKTPSQFGEIRQPTTNYLLIPKVSSERRNYLPIGFVDPSVIANGSALIVPEASVYDFGIISSVMHMTWMRQVCGRMKSDYQYSVSVVYNNYPWPERATEKQRAAVEAAAQAVLDARAQYPTSTLADLYDPLTMPAPLLKAHQALDRAVDRCYRPEKFETDRQRVEYLFALYEKLTAPLVAVAKPKRRRNPSGASK
jgi:hypothetical protein